MSPVGPAFALEKASVVRGGRVIWSHGDLSVPLGDVVIVIGPNGSGKTTLLQALMGLVPLSGGHIEVFGEPPRRGNPRIGYVPQNYTATVGDAVRERDLVAFGVAGDRWGLGRLRPAERARIDAALVAVGAVALAGRRMSSLSGGQQQRAAIAQALVGEPDLLLLDEPLANLDVRNQHEIVSLLGALRRDREVTIVVVAHDLNPLLPVLSSAIYLMDGHPHYDHIGEVVDETLLTHLYGTPVKVVRSAQGDLFTRSG
ncbi:MAG: ATP-binding cassette domain-containing protein [Actinobacteria bacterium]|nr:ATP-binding cassette domain-containing protein [Actinomycetota bacterium]